MMRSIALTMAVAAAVAAPRLEAACAYPEEIAIPDGAQASEAEMLEAQQRVKTYIAALEDYTRCLDREAAALGDAETPEQKAMHLKRHNAAVAAMQQAADSFNAQISAFKSARD